MVDKNKSLTKVKDKLELILEKVDDPKEGKNYKLGLVKKTLKEIIADIDNKS